MSSILYSTFILLFSLIIPYKGNAQTLQKLYSGLEKASSVSVTQHSIYIVEQGENRLLQLDHSGKLVETIGGKGSGNYQLSKPIDVDATNGLKIFVTDFNNQRVQIFGRRGQYLSSISGHSIFGATPTYNPTQVYVNNLGEVFFADESAKKIYRFDLDSNFLDEFRIPSEIKKIDDLIVSGQNILILDVQSKTIHELIVNGSYQKFYPAEGVYAFFADEQNVWKVFSTRVEIENKSKETRTIFLDKQIEPVDVQVHDGIIYILTSDSLFKIPSK